MSFNFAYLSGGKLYLKFGQAKVQAIKSEFGQAAQERGWQMQRRNGWKRKHAMSTGLAGDVSPVDAVVPIAVQGVCPTSADRLIYTLEAGEIGGIFTLERLPVSISDQQQPKEKRLFHSADFKVDRVHFHPEHKLIACAVVRKDGTANIATMPVDAVHLEEVTEGDAIDLAPKWVPGDRKAIVFQSSGISRNRSGYIIEHEHSTIQLLDLDRQEVVALASDPKYDLLSPQISTDGTLYYIRRPYQPLRQQIEFSHILKEIVLIPARLLTAIFGWLNFFTHRYTGKSLFVASQTQPVANQQMFLLGRVVNIGVEMERNRRFGDADSPALVPRSWQLIEQPLHGEPQVIGAGVLAFDVGLDGKIVYSNGSAIYGICPGGVVERLVIDRPIEQVVTIEQGNDLN
ncbi:MAG: hypothetical protein RLZZ135_1925 [Cyanobacteriota bacterium]|jgi:hypothetical protein